MYHQIFLFLEAQLRNQFVGGGLVLMISGSIVALCRRTPGQIGQWTRNRFTRTVEILNDDPLYDYVSFWLNAQPYTKKARVLTATTATRVGKVQDGPSSSRDENKPKPPEIIFTPAPGTHFFLYRGRPLRIIRTREKTPPLDAGSSAMGGILRKQEAFSITAIGRDQSLLRDLVRDIAEFGSEPETGIRIFFSSFGYWQSSGRNKPRPLDSVVLPMGMGESVCADAKRFLSSEHWYRSVGIPWHRGYLFHGLPGSGKTSLVSALAGELGMDLYLLNISGSGMSDERLSSLMAEVRPGTMVLMEDVDCAVPDRDSQSSNRVSLAGLLNCLDGVMSREGCMIFMTTNRRDKLDPALIRPGRIDYEIEFGLADQAQIAKLADRLGVEYEIGDLCGVTMADAQKRLLLYADTSPLPQNIKL